MRALDQMVPKDPRPQQYLLLAFIHCQMAWILLSFLESLHQESLNPSLLPPAPSVLGTCHSYLDSDQTQRNTIPFMSPPQHG